jgi:hypothetical protein
LALRPIQVGGSQRRRAIHRKTHGPLPMPDIYLNSDSIFHVMDERRMFPPRNPETGELFEGPLGFYQEPLIEKFILRPDPMDKFLKCVRIQ